MPKQGERGGAGAGGAASPPLSSSPFSPTSGCAETEGRVTSTRSVWLPLMSPDCFSFHGKGENGKKSLCVAGGVGAHRLTRRGQQEHLQLPALQVSSEPPVTCFSHAGRSSKKPDVSESPSEPEGWARLQGATIPGLPGVLGSVVATRRPHRSLGAISASQVGGTVCVSWGLGHLSFRLQQKAEA